MRAFRLLATSLVAALSIWLGSCSIWKEYRADANDDYGLSSWKFNSDGSGLFIVKGITNTQKVSFTWEITNSSTVTVNLNGEESTLELSNGLLIENSALGSVVFKKQ